MSRETLLTLLDEGVRNGRVSAHVATFVAARVLGVDPHETGYADRMPLEDADERRP